MMPRNLCRKPYFRQLHCRILDNTTCKFHPDPILSALRYLKHALDPKEKDICVKCDIFEWSKIALMSSLNPQSFTDKKKESFFSAIYIGGVFIILALVYFIHVGDNVWNSLVNFFTSLTLAPVPATGISLPAPSDPSAYFNLYNAAFQFAIAIRYLGNSDSASKN